jgi:hypothetical protein
MVAADHVGTLIVLVKTTSVGREGSHGCSIAPLFVKKAVRRELRMDELSSALEVLSAMITPAVLISGCGTLVLSTSNRLVHVIARVRDLSDRFERLTEYEGAKRQSEKLRIIISQLELLTSRARLLQRSLVSLYSAIGIFVLTTFDIGITASSHSHRLGNAAVMLGLIGAAFLCYSSLLLIVEARRAFTSTKSEMNYLLRQISPSSDSSELPHRFAK